MTPEQRGWLAALLGLAALLVIVRGFWAAGYTNAGDEIARTCGDGSAFSYRGSLYICRPMQ